MRGGRWLSQSPPSARDHSCHPPSNYMIAYLFLPVFALVYFKHSLQTGFSSKEDLLSQTFRIAFGQVKDCLLYHNGEGSQRRAKLEVTWVS